VSEVYDGGPAFARSKAGSGGSAEESRGQSGMSLRAYIATHVLAALNGSSSWDSMEAKTITAMALAQADALIAALTEQEARTDVA